MITKSNLVSFQTTVQMQQRPQKEKGSLLFISLWVWRLGPCEGGGLRDFIPYA